VIFTVIIKLLANNSRRITKMATKNKKTRKTPTPSTGEVFRSIVSSILTRKKEFTSTEIAEAASASPRHSRRTLAELAQKRVLKVQRGSAPFVYTVAKRDTLRRMVA